MIIKILLVDDEPLEREVLRRILAKKSEQYTVVGELDNGQDAVDYVKKHPVDIVIMDIKMPKMTGIEASRLMKKWNPRIGIVIVTAYNDFEFAQYALKYNVDDYLLKPTRPEQVFEALKRAKEKIGLMSMESKSPSEGFKEKFSKYCRKGCYKEAKELLCEVRKTTFEGFEQEMETLKMLLETLLSAANFYKIDVEKNLEMEIREKLKGSKNREQYHEILHLIFEEIFEVLIEEKRIDHEDEMTYALQYIDKNLTRNLTLERVADYMNISPHYFSKLFKSEVGENFIDYVTSKKVERAKEMIKETDIPLNTIAFDLGFNEANYFSKVFKKISGMTPSQFRKLVEEERKMENQLLKRNTFQGNGKWII